MLSMQSGATCLHGLCSVCIHVATPLKRQNRRFLCASIAVASSASEESRGNETALYTRHFTSFHYREIATPNKSARNDNITTWKNLKTNTSL